jgi:DNA repair photolyase
LKKHLPTRDNFDCNWGCSYCDAKDSIKRISSKFEAQKLEIDFEVIMVEFMVVFLLREKGAYFRISYDCMGW